MKIKNLMATMAIAGVAAIGLSACGNSGGALKDKNDVYGMSAVTAVKLLGSEVSSGAIAQLSSVGALRTASADTSVKQQAEEFHKYVQMMDGFLGEDIVSTTVVENTDVGYEGFAYKLTITGKNLLGDDVSNLMYYSETLAKEEFDDDDKDEVERTYRLEGVLVMDGVDYPMVGERNEEAERNESESEILIRAYLNAEDKGTYVQVEQEISEELGESEREYVYSVYQGGKLIEKTEIEFETERGKFADKAEYEVEFLSGNGRGRYEVNRISKGGEAYLKVNYLLDGQRGSFTVKEENGKYVYTFSDGSSLTLGGESQAPAPEPPAESSSAS